MQGKAGPGPEKAVLPAGEGTVKGGIFPAGVRCQTKEKPKDLRVDAGDLQHRDPGERAPVYYSGIVKGRVSEDL